MPRMLGKDELWKTVVDASRLDRFWLDTIHPSNGRTLVDFPEGLVGHDVQVVYVPVKRTNDMTHAKRCLCDSSSGLDLFNSLHKQGPILEDVELSAFDRAKDFGRFSRTYCGQPI